MKIDVQFNSCQFVQQLIAVTRRFKHIKSRYSDYSSVSSSRLPTIIHNITLSTYLHVPHFKLRRINLNSVRCNSQYLPLLLLFIVIAAFAFVVVHVPNEFHVDRQRYLRGDCAVITPATVNQSNKIRCTF